ncbi:hypothetical protein HNR26_003863 [Rhizobium rosettiformans]|uniref:Uncharacterized protein n=2 Tax=Rhizobium rosettiformans TaxID=1368430 RepID=A0A4V4HQ94_9HYPH|nr:hypothetical protein [Rhizobium rosettiformans]MBB5277774.1 hypothetical protein [Rhizobium rosettiformans]THV32936.1 hypothetical protein FAA86_18775 [Rhizobium rosettiformans W3]
MLQPSAYLQRLIARWFVGENFPGCPSLKVGLSLANPYAISVEPKDRGYVRQDLDLGVTFGSTSIYTSNSNSIQFGPAQDTQLAAAGFLTIFDQDDNILFHGPLRDKFSDGSFTFEPGEITLRIDGAFGHSLGPAIFAWLKGQAPMPSAPSGLSIEVQGALHPITLEGPVAGDGCLFLRLKDDVQLDAMSGEAVDVAIIDPEGRTLYTGEFATPLQGATVTVSAETFRLMIH